MNNRLKTTTKLGKGHAMTEMLLCLPLLMFLAAGMVQFSILFIAKNTFEHACGESARSFALHEISSEDFINSLWDNLSSFQPFFQKSSIQILENTADPFVDRDTNEKIGTLQQFVTGTILDYGGKEWQVSINCKVTPFFKILFPNGVFFTTRLAVLRHPQ